MLRRLRLARFRWLKRRRPQRAVMIMAHRIERDMGHAMDWEVW